MSSYFEDELDGASQPGRAHGVTGVDAEQLLPADPDASGVNHDGAEKDEQPASHEEIHEEPDQEGSSEADEEQLRKRKQKKKKLLLIAAAGLVMAAGLYGLMDETPAPRKPANGTTFEVPSASRSDPGSEEVTPAEFVRVPAASAAMLSEQASTPAAAPAPVAASAASAPASASPAQEASPPRPSADPASSVAAATPAPVAASAATAPAETRHERVQQEVKSLPRAERPSAPVRQAARPHAAESASSATPEKTITLAGYHLDAIYPTSGDANLIAYIRTPAGVRTVKVGDVLPNGVKVVGIRNSSRSMKTTAGTLKME